MTGLFSVFEKQSARSIRFRLLAIMALASALWIGVTALASYVEYSNRIEQEFERTFSRELSLLEKILEQRASAARSISRSLYIVADAKALFSGDSEETLNKLIAELPESLGLNYMAVVETNGAVLAASKASGEFPDVVGKNLFQYANTSRFQADASAFLEPAPDPFLSDSVTPNGMSAVTQWILVPVNEGGRTFGWLLLSSNWQQTTNALLESARSSLKTLGLDITGVFMELQNGKMVASSPSSLSVATSEKLFLRSLKLSPALQGLKLSMAVDKSLPRARVIQSVLYRLGFAAITLIVMLVLFNVVFQRLVLDRLARLKGAAEEMIDPEKMLLLPVVYDDELGGLEKSFNSMARCLQQSYSTLEDTVDVRTKALADALAQMERFNYIASHDLREPIRTVQTYCEMLRMDLPTLDQEAEADMRFIESATTRMGVLVDDLLLYSRNRSQSISPEMLSLQSVLKELVGDHRALILESKVCITFEGLHDVYADKEQVRHVLRNLLTNGIKYHRAGGTASLSISSRMQGCWVEIQFEDNGIGIDPEHHDSIFEPFKRLHNESEFKGTGIGLSVVAESVRRHGGNIAIESDLGRGSRFVLWLPSSADAMAQGLQQQCRAIEGAVLQAA